MKFTPARIAGLAVAFAIFVADQLMKFIVTGPLALDEQGETLRLLPIFDLQFTRNIGVSLGLLPATSPLMRWGLVALTGLIALGVAWWMRREKNRADLIALGMVLGGAIGNILDRTRLGYVVDYADLHFGNWRPFLIFNVADAAISIGVAILLIRALLVKDKAKAEDGAAGAAVEKKLNA